MAKKVKLDDLKKIIEISFEEAFSCDKKSYNVKINSISAIISHDTPYVEELFVESHWSNSDNQALFNDLLKIHAGENLKCTYLSKKKQFIIQIEYEILE